MATRLKDIAKHTGLSIPTVSLALSGKKVFSAETMTKIQDAVEALSYRPNAAARTIRSGKFGAVTYLWPQGDWYMPEGLLQGINAKLANEKMNLNVAELPSEMMLDTEYIPKILQEQGTDGILINYMQNIPEKTLDLIASCKLPVIWLNAKSENDCISPNDFLAGEMAAEHLIAHGHTNIAFLCFMNDDQVHYSVEDRQNGFVSAAKKHGIEPKIYRVPRSWDKMRSQSDDRMEIAREILQEDNRPTAFFCYENHEASPLSVAAISLGMSIPDDLSIVTTHKQVLSEMGFAIDSLVVDWNELGQKAVKMLTEKIDKPKKSIKSVTVDYKLVKCGSTINIK